ncbi:MAG: methyltransferase domain-containing protein [Chloroflexi bacterium]|nr:methyltransferase domain-containing protein [Chloroflexota bacterium]
MIVSERNVCRACRADLQSLVLDFGEQPVADVLLEPEQVGERDRTLPLRLFVCDVCGLAQLPSADVDAGDLTAVHGHGAAFSTTVQDHLQAWAETLVANVGPQARVLDVASEDGVLLGPFADRGAQVCGVEAGHFGTQSARALVATHGRFDLILVNHALAHAVDLDDFVAGLACALRPGGSIAIEFHHALSLIRGHFDVACHAHRSYLSMHALESALARYGLVIVDAEQIDLHGGSVRATACHGSDERRIGPGVGDVRAVEHASGLETSAGYAGVADTAERVRAGLLEFLERTAGNGARVVGYGAPSRGITLLNYCAVTTDRIDFTVDRSPAKQGRFLPGSRIPVLAPDAIRTTRPEFVLILPWALSHEIVQQMRDVREWGGQFVVAVPELRILN